jgi:hypothetical protein
MTQFDIDYAKGKQSEEESLNDLNKIFKTNLIHDDDKFTHFDFYSEDRKTFVELKTRENTEYDEEKEIFIHTKQDGKKCYFDSLYFDAVKKWEAYRNRDTDKRYFIVWKISGEYFYWEINHGKREYYIEDQFRDRGKGYRQETPVVNVKQYALTRVI